MKNHETVPVALKIVDIDKEIVPLFEWLNRKKDVYTLYCCQGEDGKQKPYIVFLCFNGETLTSILDTIQLALGYPSEHAGWYMQVDHNIPEYPVRYCVRFKNERSLERLQEAIGKQTR